MTQAQYDVIVVGGGPAGSTLATLLAKKNRRVLLLEREKFPRYHIGESLVYGVIPILKELGVLEKVDLRGFTRKYGGSFIWGHAYEPWHFDWSEFPDTGMNEYTYQVTRSEFDNILLRHAESLGVDVREEHRVVEALFENQQCVGVKYQNPNGDVEQASAKYIVDATGQSAFLGNSLKLLKYDAALKNIAFWSYYKGVQRDDGRLAGNTYIENTEKGWLWLIPLADDVMSVGLVTAIENLKTFAQKDLNGRYLEGINASKHAKQVLANAERIDEMHTIRDWSYQCQQFYGPGFLMVGDAAGFVDPLFSTGVFLAMNGGSLGAKIIDQALNYPQRELDLFAQYESAYRKFLGVILSFVQYFYDASREVDSYYEKAKDLIDPLSKLTSREEFVFLISGLHGLYLAEHEKIVAEGLNADMKLDKELQTATI